MPKASARRASARPMRPKPMRSSVRPDSSIGEQPVARVPLAGADGAVVGERILGERQHQEEGVLGDALGMDAADDRTAARPWRSAHRRAGCRSRRRGGKRSSTGRRATSASRGSMAVRMRSASASGRRRTKVGRLHIVHLLDDEIGTRAEAGHAVFMDAAGEEDAWHAGGHFARISGAVELEGTLSGVQRAAHRSRVPPPPHFAPVTFPALRERIRRGPRGRRNGAVALRRRSPRRHAGPRSIWPCARSG